MSGRAFDNFVDSKNEIRRDLAEMGVAVHTRTYQDKVIEDDEDMSTLELMAYQYTVHRPRIIDLEVTQPWANLEWEERVQGICGNPVNPGVAWESRADVWTEFLHDGEFSYTYSERLSIGNQVNMAIGLLKRDMNSRQAQVHIRGAFDNQHSLLYNDRQPCSNSYHFLYRQGALHVIYDMRSCDFATHFDNDIFFALRMQQYVAKLLEVLPGSFTHIIHSLHVFKKDVKNVF